MDLILTRNYTSYTNFVYEDISEWGVGTNPDLTDVAAANLTIVQVGTSNTIYDASVLANYTAGNLIFTVPYDSNGTVIPDGVYSATLDITYNSGLTDTVTLESGSYFVVQALVYQRIARIPEFFKCNDCCNQFIKETLCMKMLLDALVTAAMYSDMDEFSDILNTLTTMVNYDTTYELT